MSKSTPNRVDDRGREAGQQEREPVRVGIYARVSSDQQAQQQTIQSQVSALRERVIADGHSLAESLCFLDDGVSGATLMRPALEKLRDAAYAGGVAKLYVHSPDRLARKYAWQVLLVDELHSHGVELVFLNHTMGASPEAASAALYELPLGIRSGASAPDKPPNGGRKATCCCRCRACSPSTNARRFSNDHVAESAMRLSEAA
jgi:hypothetical protein